MIKFILRIAMVIAVVVIVFTHSCGVIPPAKPVPEVQEKEKRITLVLPLDNVIENKIKITSSDTKIESNGKVSFKLSFQNITKEQVSFKIKPGFFSKDEKTEFERLPIYSTYRLKAGEGKTHEYKYDFSGLQREVPQKIKLELVFIPQQQETSKPVADFTKALQSAQVRNIYLGDGDVIKAGPLSILIDPRTGEQTKIVKDIDLTKNYLVPCLWYNSVDRQVEIFFFSPRPEKEIPKEAELKGVGESAYLFIPDKLGKREIIKDVAIVIDGARKEKASEIKVIRKLHPNEVIVYTGAETQARIPIEPDTTYENVEVWDKNANQTIFKSELSATRITGVKVIPSVVRVGELFDVVLSYETKKEGVIVAAKDFYEGELKTTVKSLSTKGRETSIGSFVAKRPGIQVVQVSAEIYNIAQEGVYRSMGDNSYYFPNARDVVITTEDGEHVAIDKRHVGDGIEVRPNIQENSKNPALRKYLPAGLAVLIPVIAWIKNREGDQRQAKIDAILVPEDNLSKLEDNYADISAIITEDDNFSFINHWDTCFTDFVPDNERCCSVITCVCPQGRRARSTCEPPLPPKAHQCPTSTHSCSCGRKKCSCTPQTIMCNPGYQHECVITERSCRCGGEGCNCPSEEELCSNTYIRPEIPYMPCDGIIKLNCQCGGERCTCGARELCSKAPVSSAYIPCGGRRQDPIDCGNGCCNCRCRVNNICNRAIQEMCCQARNCTSTQLCHFVNPGWGDTVLAIGTGTCATTTISGIGIGTAICPGLGTKAGWGIGATICLGTSLVGFIGWGAQKIFDPGRCSNTGILCIGGGQGCRHNCGCGFANCGCKVICACSGCSN